MHPLRTTLFLEGSEEGNTLHASAQDDTVSLNSFEDALFT